jgi:uncharacterized protein
MRNLKLSRYLVVTEPFAERKELPLKQIIFSTRTTKTWICDAETWQAIAGGKLSQLSSKLINELRTAEILVPSEQNELAEILNQNRTGIINNSTLYLVVQPTATCQLGCGYCGQQHTPQGLSLADQERFLDRARKQLSSGQYNTLEIGWFGGEPLLGLPVMRSLSPQLKELAQQFGCDYSATITTNGLRLTTEVAEELSREHNVTNLEVTLDGTDIYHDARRHSKKGLPTFWTIFNNVLSVVGRDDLNLKIGLRCNVDRRNWDGVVPLLHLLVQEGIHNRIEKFYVASIHSWGNDVDDIAPDPEEFAAWQIAWFAEMAKLGFNVGLIPKRNEVVCMAVQPDSALVDAYGNLFNCTEVSYVPTYEIETAPNQKRNLYAIGDLRRGEEPGKRELLSSFYDKVEMGEYPCNSCNMLPTCGGACPKQWLEGIKPCPPAKYNMKERLILQYLLSTLTLREVSLETEGQNTEKQLSVNM